MTVHSHCVESFDVGERGVAVKCEKNTIFPEHPVHNISTRRIGGVSLFSYYLYLTYSTLQDVSFSLFNLQIIDLIGHGIWEPMYKKVKS